MIILYGDSIKNIPFVSKKKFINKQITLEAVIENRFEKLNT